MLGLIINYQNWRRCLVTSRWRCACALLYPNGRGNERYWHSCGGSIFASSNIINLVPVTTLYWDVVLHPGAFESYLAWSRIACIIESVKRGLWKSYAITAYDFWARAHYALLVLRTLVCVQTVQLLVNACKKCCIHPLQLVISERKAAVRGGWELLTSN